MSVSLGRHTFDGEEWVEGGGGVVTTSGQITCDKQYKVSTRCSAYTIHCANVGLMLDQRRRRWPNIKPTLIVSIRRPRDQQTTPCSSWMAQWTSVVPPYRLFSYLINVVFLIDHKLF